MNKKGRGWSYWSRNKLEILQGYMPAFNQASKSVTERIYIDLMAGEPVNFDKHTKKQSDGSARLALASQPGFTRFAFGEMPTNAAKLKADLDTRQPGAPFKVYPGDCNVRIKQMLADLADVKWAPTFAFLDQHHGNPDGVRVAELFLVLPPQEVHHLGAEVPGLDLVGLEAGSEDAAPVP